MSFLHDVAVNRSTTTTTSVTVTNAGDDAFPRVSDLQALLSAAAEAGIAPTATVQFRASGGGQLRIWQEDHRPAEHATT